jgi:hypothetical protein
MRVMDAPEALVPSATDAAREEVHDTFKKEDITPGRGGVGGVASGGRYRSRHDDLDV